MTIRSSTFLLALLLSMVSAGAGSAAPDPRVAGHWLLDPERSDSPERASRQALRDLRRSLRPRRDPARSAEVAERRAREILAPLAPPQEQVVIELGDDDAVFRFDERPPRRHHTDGRAAVIDSSRPEVSIAAWEDGRLYVEQTFDAGMRVTATWHVEGDRLISTWEARNNLFRDPIRFRLSFHRDGSTTPPGN